MLPSLKNVWRGDDPQSQDCLRADGRHDFGAPIQPSNDPQARIEAKVDRALTEIGELRVLVAQLVGVCSERR